MSSKLIRSLLIATLALSSTTALAHGIWFAERSSQLALIYGVGGDDLDTVKRRNKVTHTQGFDRQWQQLDTELKVSGPMLTLTNSKSVAAVAAVLDNGLWSKTADGRWHAKGRDAVPNALLSEHTIKYAVHLTGELRPVPALETQTLQIVPQGTYFPLEQGKMVRYQITYKGNPISGAKVIQDMVTDPDATPVLSDAKGMVELAIRNQGLNVVTAVYDSPSDTPAIIDKTEHLATLSFILPHAEE